MNCDTINCAISYHNQLSYILYACNSFNSLQYKSTHMDSGERQYLYQMSGKQVNYINQQDLQSQLIDNHLLSSQQVFKRVAQKIQKPNPMMILSCLNLYLTQNREAINQFLQKDNEKEDVYHFIREFWESLLEGKKVEKKLISGTEQNLRWIINLKIESIISNMSEKDKQFYEQTLKFSNRIMKDIENLQCYTITLKDLIKGQILSLLFKINTQVITKYEINFQKFPIRTQTLAKLFDYKTTLIKLYCQRYQQFEQFIQYDYRENCQAIVILVLLLDLKKRYDNSIIKTHKEQKQLLNQEQLTLKKRQINYIRQKHFYFFKFCQLMLIYPGNHFDEISPTRKYTIIDQLRALKKLNNYSLEKSHFLKIKYFNAVSLKSLQYIFSAILKTSPITIKHYEYQLNIKSLISQCQWIFINNTQNFYSDFQKLVNWKYLNPRPIYKQTYTSNLLFKLLKERFFLYRHLVRCQIQLLNQQNTLQQVYVCRFQYSFQHLKGIKENSKAQKDVRCTLILGVKGQDIIFYAINRWSLSNPQNNYKLKNAFLKLQEIHGQKRYVIYFYERLSSKFIPNTQYLKLVKFFKQELNSYLIITNLFEKFLINFLVHAQVQICLKYISQKLTKENFFQYCQQIIKPIVFKIKTQLKNGKRLKQIKDNQ